MKKFWMVLVVLVAALMAAGCLDYAKAPGGSEMESPEPTQFGPEAECVEDIDCPAGFSCDQGECVFSKPEPTLEPDTFAGEPDTEAPVPEADTATGGVDTSVPPSPDTVQPSPDTEQPGIDTIQPGPDTATPSPDTVAPQPDTEVPSPDTIQPQPDVQAPEPDAQVPGEDTSKPQVDTNPPSGEDVTTPSEPDVTVGEPDVEAPSPDAVAPPIPSSDASAEAEAPSEPDAEASPSGDAGADGEGDAEGEPDAEPEPSCIPIDEICGNAVDEDCDGEDVPCPPPEPNKVAIAVDDPESESLSLQTDVTFNGPLGWETYEDTVSPFGWDLEIGPSDSESELYRLNFFRKPAGDWICQVPFGGVPTCLILPTLSVDGEVIEVEDFTDRVIIPAEVAALMCDPRYEACAVANIGYCRGEQACEIACDNGLDDDGDGLIDLADPHCN